MSPVYVGYVACNAMNDKQAAITGAQVLVKNWVCMECKIGENIMCGTKEQKKINIRPWIL